MVVHGSLRCIPSQATPLIAAAMKGHCDVVKDLLVVDGIEVNRATSTTGATALIAAATGGYVDCVRTLLVATGTDATRALTTTGDTALMAARNQSSKT